MNKQDIQNLLLQFIASLTLCDNMGDVLDDISTVIDKLGLNIEFCDSEELAEELHKLGIKTLYNTSLVEKEID